MIQRQFARFPLKVPLFITVGGGRLFEKAVTIECRDISGGGLSFETRKELPLDAKSKIVMGRLGNLPSSAIIEGRVIYCEKRAGTDVFTVGVEFVDFVNTTREELLDRIELWQSEPPTMARNEASPGA